MAAESQLGTSTTARPHASERRHGMKLPLPVRLTLRGLAWLSGPQPELAAVLADRLWSQPRRRQRPERELRWLEGARVERIPAGMGSLQGWSWGAGPTVLLVHGWDGRGSQLGALVRPLLEAGYRVVTFDSQGHGDSGGSRASVVSFADDLAAAVRHFGPLHGLIAHSLGGAASTYALSAGLPVERVVFLAPVNAAHGLQRFSRFAGLSEDTTRALLRRVERRYGRPLEQFGPEHLATSLRQPLLIFHDEEDFFVPWMDGVEVANAWPHAHLVSTRALGHHRILRDEGVLGGVVRFLRDGELPGTAEAAPISLSAA